MRRINEKQAKFERTIDLQKKHYTLSKFTLS